MLYRDNVYKEIKIKIFSYLALLANSSTSYNLISKIYFIVMISMRFKFINKKYYIMLLNI